MPSWLGQGKFFYLYLYLLLRKFQANVTYAFYNLNAFSLVFGMWLMAYNICSQNLCLGLRPSLDS
jgi:hypothetical protein